MATTHVNAAASGTFALGGDLQIHRLGFGAMRITGEGIWGEPKDPEKAKQVLRRALELGINFVDTADSYGPEVSERLIAEALYPYPSGLIIATKGGLTRSGPNRWAPVGRPEYLRQCVEMSLRRLKIECIDLWQLHRIDPKVPVEESLGAIKELQKQGKIRHIGLSESFPLILSARRRRLRSSVCRTSTISPNASTNRLSSIASRTTLDSSLGSRSPQAHSPAPEAR